MARITVEDCLNVVENRFELVLMASKRARQLATGVEPTLDNSEHQDKPTVMALREIAARKIDQQLIDDPQLRHNELLWDVPVGAATNGAAAPTFRTVGSPLTFSRTPTWVRRSVPRLGQHTAEVMGPGVDD